MTRRSSKCALNRRKGPSQMRAPSCTRTLMASSQRCGARIVCRCESTRVGFPPSARACLAPHPGAFSPAPTFSTTRTRSSTRHPHAAPSSPPDDVFSLRTLWRIIRFQAIASISSSTRNSTSNFQTLRSGAPTRAFASRLRRVHHPFRRSSIATASSSPCPSSRRPRFPRRFPQPARSAIGSTSSRSHPPAPGPMPQQQSTRRFRMPPPAPPRSPPHSRRASSANATRHSSPSRWSSFTPACATTAPSRCRRNWSSTFPENSTARRTPPSPLLQRRWCRSLWRSPVTSHRRTSSRPTASMRSPFPPVVRWTWRKSGSTRRAPSPSIRRPSAPPFPHSRLSAAQRCASITTAPAWTSRRCFHPARAGISSPPVAAFRRSSSN